MMTENAPGGAPRDPAAGRRRAAGIYGAIITASILTAAGASLSTTELAVSIVVTLVVYWLAEQYAQILGEHAADVGVAAALGLVMVALKNLVLNLR